MTNPMQNRPVEVDTHNMVNGYFNTSINKHDMNYDSSHGGIDSAVYFHSESHRGDEAEEDANVAYQGDVANSHPITATPTGGDVTIQMEPDQPYATRRDVMDSDDNNEDDDDDECEEEDDCEDAVGSDFLGALVDSSLPLAERERAVAKEIRHKITGGSVTTNVGTTGAGATGVEEFYRHCSNLSAVHCMRLLHTTTSGLSSSASAYRLEVFGPNCLDSSNRATWYKQLIGCFMHPFNILLLILAIIAGATNDYGSVGLLLGMISISVLISFVQERKASISAEALKSRITQHAVVRRAREPTGQVLPIDATHSSSANPRAPALIGSTVEMANVKVTKSPEFTSVRSESETSSANGVPSASGASHSNSNTLDSNTSANLFGLSSSSGAFSVESVPASKLVPGDLVLLSAGSLLPADLRIIACSGLLINQTVLTGESLPVEKGSQAYRMKQSASLDESNPSSEDHWLRRSNLAFMGSSVDSGSGVGVVLATGGLTYFGRNAKDLQASRPPSDFSKGVKQVSYVLMTFTLIMLPLVIIINGITSSDWVEAALFGAAVAVGITPAMLPMIVNGNLSLAAHRLSKRKCLVKRLESIQNLGAINILAVDKTGTLTNDHVSLQGHLSVDGASCDRVLDTAYMIAKLQQGFRNVLDHAIIRAYEERYTDGTKPSGFGAFVKELPFDFQRRRMSVIVDSNPDRMLYCKGALAEMIRVCTHYIDPESQLVCPLDQNMLTQLHELGQSLASQGMRVLGVGKKVANDGPVSASQGWTTLDEAKLTLVGVLTFLDEPKESAGPALDLLRSLSVHVKVLTGDNPLVAKQVCSQLGMKDVQMLTGDDMTRLTSDDDDPVLQQLFYDTVIFSQLAPHDKARVVRCLRFRGDVVGMLGDGVNDALALREADVGISVDTGTELAKDAADIILTEKDLVVLADAVQTGRLTYANSIKYIKMASSGNFGNVFSLLFAAAWLPFLPIHSLQLLTQNLLYDISQIAIPFDSMDESYLRTPKRWSGGNLASFMICIGPVSSVFDIATFMIAFYYYGYDDKDDVRAVSSFQTMWFMQGLMTQTLIVHMIRTEKIPFIQSRPPIQLLLTTLVVTAIGFIIPYIPPVADMLDMVSPPGSYFGFLAALMMGYSVLLYFVKRLYMAKFKEWL